MNTLDKVKSFYTRYSYPNYPLLATPLWQYGYLGSSFMAGNLFKNNLNKLPAIYKKDLSLSLYHKDNIKHILIAGSGEILPYILRKFEPSFHHITCLDLSSTSLKRARLRLLFNFKNIEFITSDIDRYLDKNKLMFDHIDCFGVAHHLLNPSYTIEHLSSYLKEDGTIRMMVYNYPARWWIHSISSIFKVMGFCCFNKLDLKLSRSLLSILNSNFKESKLSFYLKAIGKTILDNDVRFSDTFFHPRELRLEIKQWFSIWDKANLTPLGLYDRYMELKDLECSLYKIPSIDLLEQRSLESTFMGNLELYFSKKEDSISKNKNKNRKDNSLLYLDKKNLSFTNRAILFKEFFVHYFKSSPFNTESSFDKKIYHSFLERAKGFEFNLDSLIKKYGIDLDTLKTLIRKAYVFPDQISLHPRKKLISSMNENIGNNEGKDEDKNQNNKDDESMNKDKLDRILDKFLSKNSIVLSDKKLNLIRKRLYRLIPRF